MGLSLVLSVNDPLASPLARPSSEGRNSPSPSSLCTGWTDFIVAIVAAVVELDCGSAKTVITKL